MSIAGEWGRQRAVPPKANAPVTQADAIMRRVLAAVGDEDDLEGAADAMVEAVARIRVTFRKTVVAKRWDFKAVVGAGHSFAELEDVEVPAGSRGRVVGVVIDGRSLVRLDRGTEVVSRLGSDCLRLRWWHRLYDRIMRRG